MPPVVSVFTPSVTVQPLLGRTAVLLAGASPAATAGRAPAGSTTGRAGAAAGSSGGFRAASALSPRRSRGSTCSHGSSSPVATLSTAPGHAASRVHTASPGHTASRGRATGTGILILPSPSNHPCPRGRPCCCLRSRSCRPCCCLRSRSCRPCRWRCRDPGYHSRQRGGPERPMKERNRPDAIEYRLVQGSKRIRTAPVPVDMGHCVSNFFGGCRRRSRTTTSFRTISRCGASCCRERSRAV